MNVELYMEEKHLIKGEQENDYACPIALLLMESDFCKKYNVFPQVSVDWIRFYTHTEETKTDPYNDDGCKSRVARKNYEQPNFIVYIKDEMQDWISDYDDNREMPTLLPATILPVEKYFSNVK